MSSLEEDMALVKRDIAETKEEIKKAKEEGKGEIWNKLMDYLIKLQRTENILLDERKRSVVAPVTSKQYWFVSFRVKGSKSKVEYRAHIFVVASKCMAFYYKEMNQSIYYDENDLVIKVLFETQDHCRQFYEQFFITHNPFSVMMPVELIDPIQSTTLEYEPIAILSNHYDTNQFDSPMHSMSVSDYLSDSVDGPHEGIVSVCSISDPSSRLQMIENPDHPFLRGLKMYRCHLQSKASNKRQKGYRNNILHMSWDMHQRFNGLDLVGGNHMVPSLAFKLINSEMETVEIGKGCFERKYKVTIAIESNNDLELLNVIGPTLKRGSEFDSVLNRWITFVHVDNDEEFKNFLGIRYDITKELWRQNIPIGEEIDDEKMEEIERRAITTLPIT